MALSNRQRVEQALELLNRGLLPYVEREMKAVYGPTKWEKQATLALGDKPLLKGGGWDTAALLTVMIVEWNNVFKRGLGQTERSIVSEMREVRNRWAHQETFSTDDTYRVFDNVHRLLSAIGAKEAIELERQKQDILRVRFEEQAKKETVKAAIAPVESPSASSLGLKPWREVITPHPDVSSGRYQQAEFAADLGQVYRNEGSDEYRDPIQFFQRTYVTQGLRTLLVDALQRLSGTGGDPIIELQTNFGGGKTHSMIALYHFFSGTSASKLPHIEPVLEEAKTNQLPKANRAVLVGHELPLAEPQKKKDGTIVRTMWGELAWQLLRKDGYELVAEADRKGVSPGSAALRDLFTLAEPCLVLIDEWVAHARQLLGKDDLPAGSFESNFSFAQELTEAAKACGKTLVVASVPSSDQQRAHESPWVDDLEVGGENGKVALARLKNVFGRVQSPWRPASAEESFEIVRRRLFQPMTGDAFKYRDAVIRQFMDFYNTQKSEFPSGSSEGEYRRRMEASYPLHPELFDRLYEDWSSLQRFQRTRGVLRLMAAAIHALWTKEDRNLLIMPANMPLDDAPTVNELMLYVDEALRPIIEREIDGVGSLALQLDKDNPNFGRLSAARRVARTVFIGSAPRLRTPNKGIEDKRIMLGCVQPGEVVGTFRDALRRLTDRASHLYVDHSRYWFDTQPSINRVAQDRAESIKQDLVWQEIENRLRGEAKSRGDFERVQVVENASQSGDVPDERDVRLVIIGPENPHVKGGAGSSALTVAQTILEQRGNSPRTFKNSLIFVAADSKALDSLQQAARAYLAWKSIDQEKESMDIGKSQEKQIETKLKDSDAAIRARIPETYTWVLVPEQEPTGSITFREVRVTGTEYLAPRISKKLVNDGLLITNQWAGVLLRRELDRIPLWRGDSVSVKQLADDFATYVYLPRLRSTDVLFGAIADGAASMLWEKETFAYAAYIREDGRYMSLCAGRRPPNVDFGGVVVKSAVARKQMEEEAPEKLAPTLVADSPNVVPIGRPEPTPPPLPRRFVLDVDVDPLRLPRDAGQIAEAIVAHLNGLVGAKLEISLQIQARVPNGIPENVQRTVTENCKTLKIGNFGFEEQ